MQFTMRGGWHPDTGQRKEAQRIMVLHEEVFAFVMLRVLQKMLTASPYES